METQHHHREQLDMLSLYILHLLTEEPLWQQRIYESLPADGPDILHASLQTVGRRIESLHDSGYLETCVTEAEPVNRNLLIAYRTTETGTDVLQQHDICTDCDQVHPAWEHRHDLVDIGTYFGAS